MWTPELRPGQVKYAAIVAEIKRAIESGLLRANEPLPPQRELAFRLGVNLTTVTRAYAEATRIGLVAGEVGRGTFVRAESVEARIFIETAKQHDEIDLLTVGGFTEGMTAALSGFLATSPSPASLFGYGSDLTLWRATEAAIQWCRWRGYEPASRPILCNGAQAGLDAVLRILSGQTQAILCEEYTFPGLKNAARLNELRLIPVACDAEGAMPDALAKQARMSGARIFVTVPNGQNPTGAVMSEARRLAIAETAARLGIAVVEDDVYGALCGQPPLVNHLQGEHVYITSLSKCVAPGLKFGFVAGRHPALERLAQEVTLTTWLTSPLLHGIAADLISSGTAQGLARRHSENLSRRMAVGERVFGTTTNPCSPFLWLAVPGDATEFAKEAALRGVLVACSGSFSAGRRRGRFVRASAHGDVSETKLLRGLTILQQMGARREDR